MNSVNWSRAIDVDVEVCQSAIGLVKQLSEINNSGSNEAIDVSGTSYFHRDTISATGLQPTVLVVGSVSNNFTKPNEIILGISAPISRD
jgi:hypothetical protein